MFDYMHDLIFNIVQSILFDLMINLMNECHTNNLINRVHTYASNI